MTLSRDERNHAAAGVRRWHAQAAVDRVAQILSGFSFDPPIATVIGIYGNPTDLWVDFVDVTIKPRLVYDALDEPTGEVSVTAELRRRVQSGAYIWIKEPVDDLPSRAPYWLIDVRTRVQVRVTLTP